MAVNEQIQDDFNFDNFLSEASKKEIDPEKKEEVVNTPPQKEPTEETVAKEMTGKYN